MANCNSIIGVAYSCDDNNAGAIKAAWIGDFRDVVAYTLDSQDPVTGGAVTAMTMSGTSTFEEFVFKKNTSSYNEKWVGDLTADVHLWEQSINIGLRRIEIAKRNAISVLAEGRRRLVVITQDNNDNYRVFGLDDGIRLSAMESGTNEARNAGTFYTITLMGEERWMAYDTDAATVASVI